MSLDLARADSTQTDAPAGPPHSRERVRSSKEAEASTGAKRGEAVSRGRQLAQRQGGSRPRASPLAAAVCLASRTVTTALAGWPPSARRSGRPDHG